MLCVRCLSYLGLCHDSVCLFCRSVSNTVYLSCLVDVFPAVVVRSSLIPFNCTVQPSGLSTLNAEPSILCTGNGAHQRMYSAGIVSVLAYGIGVPVGFALFLWRYRDAMRADQVLLMSALLCVSCEFPGRV
jgi:hypothetical protein